MYESWEICIMLSPLFYGLKFAEVCLPARQVYCVANFERNRDISREFRNSRLRLRRGKYRKWIVNIHVARSRVSSNVSNLETTVTPVHERDN